ncbi:MAG: hypothetical protein KJ749_08530 [Planctomycetes bacterium]|nr:hypothetical protein [Planctomycetota bacterium]
MRDKLLIGMSQVDITPPAPVSLRATYGLIISQYVESPLYANVFSAESGDEQIIICSCDLACFDAASVERVRELIRARDATIDTSKVILCGTELHTGPHFYVKDKLRLAAKFLPEGTRYVDTQNVPENVWLEDKCGPFIFERICDAVCRAWVDRKPAGFSPAFGRAVVGHCRRVVYDDGSARMYGAADTVNFEAVEAVNDSGIELLYLFDESRAPMGALVNVACPAQVLEGKPFVSSDFWGKARDFIKSKLGDAFVVVGLGSAAGDQSPRDEVRKPGQYARRGDPDMHSLEGAIELGRRISSVVLDKYDAARETIRTEALIRHDVLTIDFPLRTVTMSECDGAKRKFDAYVRDSGKTVFGPSDIAAMYPHAGIMERFRLQKSTSFWSSEIHVARFDDIAIATNPFELFLDYGNQIKARSAATQTMLIQLACDGGSYLPTARAERGGHYSAFVPSGLTGHAGGVLLVNKTVETIRKLWDLPVERPQ